MKRVCGITGLLIAFVLAFPVFSSGCQFKITMVYDGGTVKAEGYDKHSLP